MTAVPFPFVGALVPVVGALTLWLFTGSAFALVGAVIAPLAVVGYYLDARRRARREARDRGVRERRDAIARMESDAARAAASRMELLRAHPSVADIDRHPEWVPGMSGSTELRAGVCASGEPWLVDVAGGVAVLGVGSVADAVWSSFLVHGTAQLGEPTVTVSHCRWPGGAWVTRGDGATAAVTIRCSAVGVDSVTPRGGLPDRGARFVDDVRAESRVLARMANDRAGELAFSDRARCARGIGLAGSAPCVVELSTDTPHILIAGRTGSGKSRLLTALLLDWAERSSPAEWGFVGIDFKGGATLAGLERLPHCRAVLTDLDAALMDRALRGIAAELRRREEFLMRVGVTRIEDAAGLARLAVVIDELPEFLRQRPDAHDLLADIARRGRSLGVHLVLVAQQPWGVVRDSVLANIPVRACLAMNSPLDVSQVVGRPVRVTPTRGRALVTLGDGGAHDVHLRVSSTGDVDAVAARWAGPPEPPPWTFPIRGPIPRDGRDGFGLIDDLDEARHDIARWSPIDGDVLVVGDRGSGRTSTLRQLTHGLNAEWVHDVREIDRLSGSLVVLDDLDVAVHDLSATEHTAFVAALARLRARRPRPTVLVSSRTPLSRLTGSIANMLVLRLPTLDDHRASGEPANTFDRTAPPGTGSWRGKRVAIYASTESSDTAVMP